MKQDDRESGETVFLNGIPYAGDVAASRKQKSRPWKWLTAVSVLTIAMLVPASAHAGIFDVFSELFGTIQSDIAVRSSRSTSLRSRCSNSTRRRCGRWPR